MSVEAINIGFLGVDERSRSAYQIFFESISWAKCVLVDDLTQAQLCLIDMDAYNTEQNYTEFVQTYPEKTVLKISLDSSLSDPVSDSLSNRAEKQCNNNKEFFLKKPVKRENFQNLLRKIFQLSEFNAEFKDKTADEQEVIPGTKSNKIRSDKSRPDKNVLSGENIKNNPEKTKTKTDAVSTEIIRNVRPKVEKKKTISTVNAGKLINVKNEEHLVGYQNDVDVNDPGQLKIIYYEPGSLIQTIIERVCIKSKQKEKIIRLTILNTILYFDAQKQKVYSTSEAGIIQSLCLIPHNNTVSYIVKKLSFRHRLYEILSADDKTLEQQSWDMEAFVWLIALWSSRGRVAKGTDLSKPVALMQWPNLTRLASVPHAVRIAALLYEKPHTLPEAAELLAIEQRYVFAFYSACRAIGLTRVYQPQEVKNENHKHYKNQSLLKKVLAKLLNLGK